MPNDDATGWDDIGIVLAVSAADSESTLTFVYPDEPEWRDRARWS